MGKIMSRAFTGPNSPFQNIIKRVGDAVRAQSGTQIPVAPEAPAPLVFSNPERASRIEGSLQNAAFGATDIRSILEQLMKANYLAEGGRVGYAMGGIMDQYSENINYNPELGQIVNSANQQPIDQSQLLEWSMQNPEPLKTQNKTDPALLAQLIQTLKS
jgi:hypothetical protein